MEINSQLRGARMLKLIFAMYSILHPHGALTCSIDIGDTDCVFPKLRFQDSIMIHPHSAFSLQDKTVV